MCHEGKEITEGQKYVVKTELIFERTNKDHFVEKVKNEHFKKMMEYYEKVVNGLLYQDDLLNVTSDYLKAVDLQYKYLENSIKKDNTFPQEIILKIATFLPLNDIVKLTLVDRHWNYTILESKIWMKRMQDFYSDVYNTQLKIHQGNNIDWYGMYKRQVLIEKSKPFIIEIDDTTFKIIKSINDTKTSDPLIDLVDSTIYHSVEVIGCHNRQVNSYYFQKFVKDVTYGLYNHKTKVIGSLFSKGKYNKSLNTYNHLYTEMFGRLKMGNSAQLSPVVGSTFELG